MSRSRNDNNGAGVIHTRGKTIHTARLYDIGSGILHVERGTGFFGKVLDAVHPQRGERLLDCGCGPGRLVLAAMERLGPEGEACGIDASPNMIEVARRNAARRGLEADFRVAAVEDLPYADASFDVVTTTLVLHHLPGGLRSRALGEMLRVLVPGGRVLEADWSPATPRLRSLLRFSGHMSSDVIGQVAIAMEEVGFLEIEKGAVSSLIGYARGVKPERAV